MKIHFVYDPNNQTPTYFSMTPAKVNDFEAAKRIPLISSATYVFDRAYNYYEWYYKNLHLKNNIFEILLSSKKGQDCPVMLRRIHFTRKEDGKEIILITNDLKRSAQALKALYKQRWEIELLFKWIKQNLKIKHFLGTSENAAKIQV